jgi:hypothetical protein
MWVEINTSNTVYFVGWSIYIRKEERFQISMYLEKEKKKIKLKLSSRKEMIMVIVEVNEF